MPLWLEVKLSILSGDRLHICVNKIIALAKQRLPLRLRQRISKTIPKVKLRRMPATPAKISISLASNAGLFGSDGFDHHLGVNKKIVELAAESGVFT